MVHMKIIIPQYNIIPSINKEMIWLRHITTHKPIFMAPIYDIDTGNYTKYHDEFYNKLII